MATYNESLTETAFATDSFEADIIRSVRHEIEHLSPDARRALWNAVRGLRSVPRVEGEHRSGAVHIAGEAKVTVEGFKTITGATIPAEEARAQLVRDVPKFASLYSKLEARFKDVPAAVLAGLILFAIERAVPPPSTGSTTINNITNNFVISNPTPALSPLAQVMLGELRKIGGAVSRENILASTSLSPQDIDLGLSELLRVGVVTESAPGVFAPR